MRAVNIEQWLVKIANTSITFYYSFRDKMRMNTKLLTACNSDWRLTGVQFATRIGYKVTTLKVAIRYMHKICQHKY